jgi:hypothetical protein
VSNASSFHAEAQWQGHCQHPNCEQPLSPKWHAHHVIYEQVVEREGGDKYDTRNAMRLCHPKCHLDRQHGRQDPVPMSVVRDETIEFAVELMGIGKTINYFERRYAGTEDDPRLTELAQMEDAA